MIGRKQLQEHEAKALGIPWPLQKGWKELDVLKTLAEMKQAVHTNPLKDEPPKRGLTKKQANKERRKDRRDRRRLIQQQKNLRQKLAEHQPEGTLRTPSEEFYKSDAWREIRYKVLQIYKGECALCGRSKRVHGVTIHVDHIVPRSLNASLELSMDNLQLLCEDCNKGKSNNDSTDWRPVK